MKKKMTQGSLGRFQFFILLLSCSFLLGTEHVNASHYAGGEINYECLGSNQYRVNLVLYRDFSGASMSNQE
jgi:hypothetical protein